MIATERYREMETADEAGLCCSSGLLRVRAGVLTQSSIEKNKTKENRNQLLNVVRQKRDRFFWGRPRRPLTHPPLSRIECPVGGTAPRSVSARFRDPTPSCPSPKPVGTETTRVGRGRYRSRRRARLGPLVRARAAVPTQCFPPPSPQISFVAYALLLLKKKNRLAQM